MNAATKVVVSKHELALDRWANSARLDGDLVPAVQRLAEDRDVAVIGSMSVAHQLAAAGAVDEYRLLTIPIAVGRGTALFAAPAALRLTSIESTEIGPLAYYEPAASMPSSAA